MRCSRVPRELQANGSLLVPGLRAEAETVVKTSVAEPSAGCSVVRMEAVTR